MDCTRIGGTAVITGAVAAGSKVERGGPHVDDDPGRSLVRVRTGKEHEQVTAAVGNAVDTRQRQQVRNEIAGNTLRESDGDTRLAESLRLVWAICFS